MLHKFFLCVSFLVTIIILTRIGSAGLKGGCMLFLFVTMLLEETGLTVVTSLIALPYKSSLDWGKYVFETALS